ncbi:heterokaryon incompatibility protein het-E-1 [Fusarium beomiforme]|uniref:Heterokaryon incompatibility protein het-E-1 n=1 Tax=Fusarium beomiforme TaxID=44412 RepID=A0A9P5AQR3_9HYPO|nr:heterokaryon incompatibility protein het-E-1 [Fusarium beomiforme]
MGGLSSAVNIISTIDTSFKVIKWCYHYADDFRNCKQDRDRLLDAVSGLKLVAEKVREITKTLRGERLKTSRELQNTADDSKESIKNLEDRLRKRDKFDRLLWPMKKQGVEENIQAIEKYTQTIHQVLQVDIATIFWLNGMAGTGKSTISRRVAASAQKQDQLGATFFFKHGEGQTDRGNLTKFFTTIARNLAASQPAYTAQLVEAISEDSSIFGKTSQVQFKRLIIDPQLASANDIPHSSPIAIIIDALDECDNPRDIELLIDLLSQTAVIKKPKLRIFITSRPELPLRIGFSALLKSS